VLSAALPFATAAAVLLVGFNRTTRQDPEISTRPGYLLLSGGVLAAVCAGPFLLSRSVVVAGAKAAASAVYFGGIVPVLQLFLNNIVVQGVTWLFHGIQQFIHWLFTLFPPKPLERTEIVSTDEVIANAQKAAEDAEPLINGMSMLTVLGILLAVLCAVLVVRHFLRQKFRHTDTACTDTTVRRSTHKRARRWPGLFLSPVDKVRREYAIYLDHCQRHGVTILRGDTSLDLTGRAFGMDFAAEAWSCARSTSKPATTAPPRPRMPPAPLSSSEKSAPERINAPFPAHPKRERGRFHVRQTGAGPIWGLAVLLCGGGLPPVLALLRHGLWGPGRRRRAWSLSTCPPGGAIFYDYRGQLLTGQTTRWMALCVPGGEQLCPPVYPTPIARRARRRSTRSGTPRPRSCWRWTGMFPRWAFPAGQRHGEALPPRWQCSCWGISMARAMVLPVWKPPLTNCSPAAGRGIPCSAPSTPRESCGPSPSSPPPTAVLWGCS